MRQCDCAITEGPLRAARQISRYALPLAPHSRRGSHPKDARSEVACLATPFFSIRGGLFQELLRQRRTIHSSSSFFVLVIWTSERVCRKSQCLSGWIPSASFPSALYSHSRTRQRPTHAIPVPPRHRISYSNKL